MKRILYLSLFVLCFAVMYSCGSSNQKTSANTAETATSDAPEHETFGETFEAGEVVAYTDLRALIPETDSVTVQVKGTVDAVCQAKGCWMTFVNGEEEMMVRFKDYGFFMPKDIAGREVIANGKAFYQTTTVDELRHYAEDAGKSAEEIAAITEPKREMRFYADGVILLDE